MARSKTPPSPPKPARKRTPRGGRFAAEDQPDHALTLTGVVERDGLVIITEPELHRREAFAQAYVALGNATRAAERAGYTAKGKALNVTASRLMAEPEVRARIAEIQRDIIRRIKVDQTTVLAELTRIAFADMGKIVDEKGELLPLNMIDEDTRRALGGYKVVRKVFGEDGESVEKEVKFIDKAGALDKIGKHLGLWKGEIEDGKFTADAFLKALLEGRERVNRGIEVRQLTAKPVLIG